MGMTIFVLACVAVMIADERVRGDYKNLKE